MRAVLLMPAASPGLPGAPFCWHLSVNKHIDGNGLPALLAPITAILLNWDTVRLTSMIADLCCRVGKAALFMRRITAATLYPFK